MRRLALTGPLRQQTLVETGAEEEDDQGQVNKGVDGEVQQYQVEVSAQNPQGSLHIVVEKLHQLDRMLDLVVGMNQQRDQADNGNTNSE